SKIYNLGTNYRSASSLIDIFNQCFSADFGDDTCLWFQKEDDQNTNISYQAVKSPEVDNLEVLVEDGRSALNLIDFDEEDESIKLSSEDYNHRWLQYIKNEILYLYKESPLVYKKNKKEAKKISLNDICILSRTSKIGQEMEKILLEADIPVSYYKRQNLYSSEVAFHLELLFTCLVLPNFGNKNALKLTPFFDLDLFDYDQSKSDDKVFELFLAESLDLLTKNKWGKFKEKLLIETSYLKRYSDKIDFDFRFSILSQILEELEDLAYSENLDFPMLLSRLKKFRIDGSGGEDLHRLATEKPKVQIMTMHVSKGLEFPIVFVLDKFSNPSASPGIGNQYYDSQSQKRVFNLDKDHQKELCLNQEQDEVKRLYYVALTRASLRLYLPLCKVPKRKSTGSFRGWLTTRFHQIFHEDSNNVSYFPYFRPKSASFCFRKFSLFCAPKP
ncbi:hypothetical protein MJH12_18775, partial [bacterium]|nr:hypothetical protein [bacterium]